MVSRQQISIPAMVASDPDISSLGLSFLSYLSLASAGGRFPASPNPELLGVLPWGDWLMESHMYLLSCCWSPPASEHSTAPGREIQV